MALTGSSTPESPFAHLKLKSGCLAGHLATELVGGVNKKPIPRGLGHHLRSQPWIQTLAGHLREYAPLPHGAMQTGTQQILCVGLIIHQAQPGQPINHLIDHVRIKPLVDQATGQSPTRTGRCIQQGQGSLSARIRIIGIRSRSCRRGTATKAASTGATATTAGPSTRTSDGTGTTGMAASQEFITPISICSTVNIIQTASELGTMPQTQGSDLHWVTVFPVAVIRLHRSITSTCDGQGI